VLVHYSYQPRVVPGIGRIYRVVKRKRIPSFISGITSVIKHRFEPFFQCYKQKFMARKREVLPLTTPLLCDHLTKQTLLLISVLSVYTSVAASWCQPEYLVWGRQGWSLSILERKLTAHTTAISSSRRICCLT